MGDKAVLDVRELIVEYATELGTVVAVDHVDLQVGPGEFVGIVGESGCGKSTLLFAIAQLLVPPARIAGGSVIYRGSDMARLTRRELREMRWRDFSVVMQSAMNALNPVMSVGAQMRDVCRQHSSMSAGDIRMRSEEVLRLVSVDPVHLESYPHQLSGGMRQRAMIAMALLFTPDLVLMDEPTTALDVVAQRSLMFQIKELQQRLGFAVVFVTHDMSLLSHFADRVGVMYAGQLVELASTRQVFGAALHPYTRGLLRAFPSMTGPRVRMTGLPGSPPDLLRPPTGCRFHPRCSEAMLQCASVEPPVYDIRGDLVRCLLYENGQDGRGEDGFEESVSEREVGGGHFGLNRPARGGSGGVRGVIAPAPSRGSGAVDGPDTEQVD